MDLYYNKKLESFSTSQSEDSELLYTEHYTINKHSYPITTSDDKFKLIFDTKFGSEFYDFIRVKLYVQGTLLLPTSLYFSERKLKNEQKPPFPEDPQKRILFFRYFNSYMGPYTLATDCKNSSWVFIFQQICLILNNYRNWILEENNKLFNGFAQFYNESDTIGKRLRTIANIIQLTTLYNKIEPHTITHSVKYLNNPCISILKESIDMIFNLDNTNRAQDKLLFSIIWNYANAYL